MDDLIEARLKLMQVRRDCLSHEHNELCRWVMPLERLRQHPGFGDVICREAGVCVCRHAASLYLRAGTCSLRLLLVIFMGNATRAHKPTHLAVRALVALRVYPLMHPAS